MKIELKHSYKSIEALVTDELPDFAILIGRNGAGKTQLLDALKEGGAVIPGIGVGEIELYNMVSFHPPDSGGANHRTNQFPQTTADAYLLSRPGAQTPIEIASAIFDQFADDIQRGSGVQARDDFERDLRDEVRRLPEFTVFGAGDRESPYKQRLYAQVLATLIPPNTGRRGARTSSFDGNQAALLSAAMKLTAKLPHELTRDDIMRAWYYEGDTLANSLSAVFVAYRGRAVHLGAQADRNETRRLRRPHHRVPNQVPTTVGDPA